MKALTNRVYLIGNLGCDPTLSGTGKAKTAQFSVATKDTYRNDAGENVSEVIWHRVKAFGSIAQKAKSLTKGGKIALEGKITYIPIKITNGNTKTLTVIECFDFIPMNN